MSPMRRGARRLVLFLAVLVALVLLARNASAEDLTPEAAEVVMKQITAIRAHDFASAYALVSRELRRTFTPGEFEWMVKRAHPEVASSVNAFVVRTHEVGGFVYVTVKVQGKNGQHVEALYEVVREREGLRVNALSTRPDEEPL